MGKGAVFGIYKQKIKNYCLTCDAECEIVKVGRSKWTKEQKIPTGFMWQCKENEEHIHRKRRYEVVNLRVR